MFFIRQSERCWYEFDSAKCLAEVQVFGGFVFDVVMFHRLITEVMRDVSRFV